jgi:redox-sensitive bicupin YhaK (pirin superfamily)
MALHGHPIVLTLQPRVRSLGEFDVRRVLPAPERQMVGPFIFFDHMGPAVFPPGKGIAVRPHPHIGLATITYLFEGEIMHRDSLGFTQLIQPGAVNLMTAGSGIVHSERAGDDLDVTSRLHGIQSWMALPADREEMAPDFRHYPAAALPEVKLGRATVRVIMGEAYGARSPVLCHSPTLYAEVKVPDGVRIALPPGSTELAVYVVSGRVRIGEVEYIEGTLAIAGNGADVSVIAVGESRVMIIGGEPLGPRHIWWNFVSTSAERIQLAKADWQAARFGKVVDDPDVMPLPGMPG